MATLKIWFDREGDYLEMIFDDVPATLEEIADDVFERRATDGRVVGPTVMNVSKHDRDALSLPVQVTAA